VTARPARGRRHAADWAALGRSGPLAPEAVDDAATAIGHDDPRVRAGALGALARGGPGPAFEAAWIRAARDPDAGVRRRAAELATRLDAVPHPDLVALLDDADALVVETAAWALGELGAGGEPAVDELVRVSGGHRDPRAREAAVAALGAIGNRRGLPAILVATRDKPSVRRRAVVALAPFVGPEVDAALERAAADRDWQVRDAARAIAGER